MEIAKKKRALEEALHDYYTRQSNSESVYKRIMMKASTLQDELSKLENRLDAVHLNMAKLRKERYSVQKEVHKLQVSVRHSSAVRHSSLCVIYQRASVIVSVRHSYVCVSHPYASLISVRHSYVCVIHLCGSVTDV